jgi:hypothetical protein
MKMQHVREKKNHDVEQGGAAGRGAAAWKISCMGSCAREQTEKIEQDSTDAFTNPNSSFEHFHDHCE